MARKKKPELYPDGMWIFDSSAGAEYVEGKVYYPASLILRLDRRYATYVLDAIGRFINEKDLQHTDVYLSGTIEKQEEDE